MTERHRIESDEWYPVYSIVESDYYDKECELPDGFADRYRRAMKEFNDVQDILAAAHEGAS
jgi:hypothetical protein